MKKTLLKIGDGNNKSVSEIAKIVDEETGLLGSFTFVFNRTTLKKVSLSDYNNTVETNISKHGKSPFFLKYVEFFLVHLIIVLSFYIPLRYRSFCDSNIIDIYKYRDQLKPIEIFKKTYSFFIILLFSILVNSIFYVLFIQAKKSDLIIALVFPIAILIPVMFVVMINLFANVIFKRWFITILLNIGILLYSNIPKYVGNEVIWKTKPLSILIRYTDSFWNIRNDWLVFFKSRIAVNGIDGDINDNSKENKE